MKNEKSGKKVLKIAGGVLKEFGDKDNFHGTEEICIRHARGFIEPTKWTIADFLSIAASVTTQAADKKLKRDLRGIPKNYDTKKRKPGRPKGSKNKAKRRGQRQG